MISLKRSAADIKEERTEMRSPEMPAYHYGLTLRLEREELEKLGLIGNLPAVGTRLTLQVTAAVVGVSEEQMAGSDAECSLTLQVQAMAKPETPRGKQPAALTSKY